MRKSFIDRIFPPSPQTFLPQHEQVESLARKSSRSPDSPPRIRLHDTIPQNIASVIKQDKPLYSSSNTSPRPASGPNRLQSTPLSASVLHHDDPFLPVERAARALQESIQFLLDAQSRGLSGRANGFEQSDVASGGSRTPTQSSFTPGSSTGMRTIPIRQPAKKNVSLRGARKGIAKKMRDFAELREEELQILDTQSKAREYALDRVEKFEARKVACADQIESIQQESVSARSADLRAEAKNVKSEIEELEHRLLELRVRHRHLLNQADQLESSQESKISSFKGTITMIDREIREFLRRPPVPHALAGDVVSGQSGMYALKPERRTLEMAKEQWTSEQDTLQQRKVDVEVEHKALVEGEQLWSQSVDLINKFEQSLRVQTAQLNSEADANQQPSMGHVLSELNLVIDDLEGKLEIANSRNWNLLVCAIGTELEAFHQARNLLEQTEEAAHEHMYRDGDKSAAERELELPRDDLTSRSLTSPNGSDRSNRSLKDTLKDFPGQSLIATHHTGSEVARYESEDDEPPVDFLLSH